MFLGGSILFAVRPTVAVAQQVHLSRLPLNPLPHRGSTGRREPARVETEGLPGPL
jgi:hypothetical protein